MSVSTLSDLPRVIPIFPLPGVLLFPSAKLALNIFEPRYVAMTRDALKSDWIIGMIQPRAQTRSGEEPDIYLIGCAGKIIALSETDDGRFLITLNGIARFKIRDEFPLLRGYRRAEVDWHSFKSDMHANDGTGSAIDRPRLVGVLRQYFKARQIHVKWEEIEQAPDAQLVASLAMQCPFTLEEKQALLEAPRLADRAELIASLLTMALAADLSVSATRH